jgi:plasmid stabilization system protein ParE
MPELVHERPLELRDALGQSFRRVLVYAERQPAGTWAAWVEFVSASGDRVVQTDRETTQSTLRDVVYWAMGLQTTYFEGALDRALRRSPDARPVTAPTPVSGRGGMVSFCIRSADPLIAFRLMGTRTLVPGMRRAVHRGGSLIYVRAVEPALTEMPRIYEFLAHFQTASAAAVLAQRLEMDLAGVAATLEIRRLEVPVEGEAILRALVEAAAGGPEALGRR